MLVELSVKNFAIIDRLSMDFGPGLNIFTGETGAGKSIIIDAIALILGDRASAELIRSDTEEAEVEAFFDVSGVEGLERLIKETGIDYSNELVIKRVVQKAGRNKIYVNGSLATLVTLTEVAGRLIDIYGQNDHQSLTRPDEHLEVLDAFGEFTALRRVMSKDYRAYFSLKKERDAFLKDGADMETRRDILSFQSKEIGDAALEAGEEESLKKEKDRLSNAEKIKSAALNAERVIYSDSGSVTERLGSVLRELKAAEPFDDKIAETRKTVESNLYQLEDAGAVLMERAHSVEFDPGRLEEINERIDLIQRLKKKYGPTVEDVLKKKEAIDGEIENLENLEERTAFMESELKEAEERARVSAERLSIERKKAAVKLKSDMETELETLGMEGAVFEVIIETEEERVTGAGFKFNERGADRVRFYISANPGEEVKPLARIASGGELSRIMLALKRVTAAGRVPTLIFDEIDAGIGGAMAQVVGAKLKRVSTSRQVFCITHLPQIAAFADNHYVVEKNTTEDARTVTSVKKLEGAGKVEQISRMLGGMNVTETTRRHAKELMLAARSMSGGDGG
ncbi:MAG: DNA repair protein RecN [Thermodesulfobacteriota bacterium]